MTKVDRRLFLADVASGVVRIQFTPTVGPSAVHGVYMARHSAQFRGSGRVDRQAALKLRPAAVPTSCQLFANLIPSQRIADFSGSWLRSNRQGTRTLQAPTHSAAEHRSTQPRRVSRSHDHKLLSISRRPSPRSISTP